MVGSTATFIAITLLSLITLSEFYFKYFTTLGFKKIKEIFISYFKHISLDDIWGLFCCFVCLGILK
uniref:Uncharacterized protein n=1 Tax=Octopus bimaculoides TaxID=37653 RepID=A0A0L8HKE6_OCTBM